MYSPWTTSMPCLFSNLSIKHPSFDISSNSQECLTNSFNNLDLSNPFNLVATRSSTSSIWSLNHFNYDEQLFEERRFKENYFEPLPFLETNSQNKQTNYPQLSQKHTIIKQMIARKNKPKSSHSNSCENFSFARSQYRKRTICTFCKSNGESANVYTSHVLRNGNNEIECPVLMAYVCPKCGATGKCAHTIKYCPALSESERVALPTIKFFKEGRTSSGNQNLFKNDSSIRSNMF